MRHYIRSGKSCNGFNSSSNQCRIACSDSSVMSSSSGSSSGSSTSTPYWALAGFPTRSDQTKIMYSWHSYTYSQFDDVVSIRLYLMTTNPENVKVNTTWYSGDANPFSNSMKPYKNIDITKSAEEGQLYTTLVDAGYYVMIAIQFTKIGDSKNVYLQWYWLNNKTTSNLYTSSSPSLSYDSSKGEFSVGTAMTGRRILEFNNRDRNFGYPTAIKDEDTLRTFYLASLIDMEGWSNPYKGYYYIRGSCLERWKQGSYTVGVDFRTNTNKTKISNAINNALSEINSVLNAYGVSFTRKNNATSGDISIIVDSEYNLYEIEPEEGGYVTGGTWEHEVDDGVITSATIRLANDYYDAVPYVTYECVALEELTQSMGAGYDQVENPYNTLHTEFNYHDKCTSLTTKDKNILKLVYSSAINSNDDYTKVAVALNIPNGCYMHSTSTSNTTQIIPDTFLEAGCNYNVRVFIVNSNGQVSQVSNWIKVSVPEKRRPANFAWTYEKKQGGIVNLTAVEWNNYTARINEFREYKGLSKYSFTQAVKGNDFTAAMYNQARTAIQAISGYGTYIPQVSKGDTVTAYMMNILVSELNAIP